VPTGHTPHVALLVAFSAADAVPAGQRVQLALPGKSLNMPAGQPLHVCPLAPEKPGEHSHASSLPLLPPADCELAGHDAHSGLPGGAYEPPGQSPHVALLVAAVALDAEPAGQSVHEALPAAGLKVPARHAWQAPPLSPVKPGPHRHAAALVLPLPAVLAWAGHCVQLALPASA
jgi:hypothetical protein